jgi:hypothetical protein
MKNNMNSALMAKKLYNQPVVTIASIRTTSIICVSGGGGGGGSSSSMAIPPDATTDIQL